MKQLSCVKQFVLG